MTRLPIPSGCLFVALACAWPSPGDAEVVRYQAVAHGDVTIAGNALGLSKALNQNGPGVRGSIGTFITLNAASIDDTPANPGNPWPSSTTSNWTLNGSTGLLPLPPGSTVLHAELVWGGSYNYVEDVSAFLNDAVTLDGPLGGSASVAPDPTTAVTLSQTSGVFIANYYLRSADATTFVATQGSGLYSLRGVPATQNENINELNAAGWALIVAYAHVSAPLRQFAIVTDGRLVDEANTVDIAIAGLSSPLTGVVTGRLVAAALEGDANSPGDELLLAPAGGPFVALSTAGNPATNFFASQINDASGTLVTDGSFGTANHDAVNGVNASGARQGWDTTGIPLSSAAGHLGNGQTTATIRAASSGDVFALMAVGLAVDQAATTDVGIDPHRSSLVVRYGSSHPFTSSIWLNVESRSPGVIEASIFDLAGVEVSRRHVVTAGTHARIRIDGHDAAGRRLRSGVYFVRIRAGGEAVTRRIVLAR